MELAFVITVAWGFGTVGYGPHRARRMMSATQTVGSRLLAVTNALHSAGPSAAYRLLAGDQRIKYLGPSFGTKFLYFKSVPGPAMALILDRQIGGWLAAQARMKLMVDRWHPKSYDRYLSMMAEWASSTGLEPDTLEMILFSDAVAGTGSQWSSDEPRAVYVAD